MEKYKSLITVYAKLFLRKIIEILLKMRLNLINFKYTILIVYCYEVKKEVLQKISKKK